MFGDIHERKLDQRAQEVNDLHQIISDLREAAEIFRDFGEFSYLHRVYDLALLEHAHQIMKHHKDFIQELKPCDATQSQQ